MLVFVEGSGVVRVIELRIWGVGAGVCFCHAGSEEDGVDGMLLADVYRFVGGSGVWYSSGRMWNGIGA